MSSCFRGVLVAWPIHSGSLAHDDINTMSFTSLLSAAQIIARVHLDAVVRSFGTRPPRDARLCGRRFAQYRLLCAPCTAYQS